MSDALAMRREPRPVGFIVWLTGMSGAGKSTLSTAVARQLSPVQRVELLDGDEVRTYLSRGLGFSRADREENVRRIGYVARVLAKHEVGVITAAISPYKSSRDEVRALATQAGIPFLECYVQASLDALIARDVKGLYKKARAGSIASFTGISSPYEAPEAPEIHLRTGEESLEASVEKVLRFLEERKYIA